EVVVTQGGKVVRIIDTKKKKSVTLDSGVYELELKGKPEGLKLDIKEATLVRGKTEIARIVRVQSPPPEQAKIDPKKPGKPEAAKVGEVRRIQWDSAVRVYAVSPDGSLVLASESGAENELVLWDLAKGKVVHRLKGHRVLIYSAGFSPDGKRIVSCSPWS